MVWRHAAFAVCMCRLWWPAQPHDEGRHSHTCIVLETFGQGVATCFGPAPYYQDASRYQDAFVHARGHNLVHEGMHNGCLRRVPSCCPGSRHWLRTAFGCQMLCLGCNVSSFLAVAVVVLFAVRVVWCRLLCVFAGRL
jgi:hypothetical protein